MRFHYRPALPDWSNITTWRRLVQFSVVFFIFLIPFLNTLKIHFAKGTFYSLDIGELAMADPIAIFQVMLASTSISAAMLASLAIPLLLMVILGRVWCSWACPYYLISDGIAALRRKLGLPEHNASTMCPSRRANAFRFGFLLAGMVLVGVAGVPVLNLILPPGILSSQALVLVKFGYITFEMALIFALIMIELLRPRFWCRLFCPTGTCLSAFKTQRGIHITLDPTQCTQCGQCQSACPMGLDPRRQGHDPLCHNCGECIDVCRQSSGKSCALFFSMGTQGRRTSSGN
ncbi:4Fe-4S ferredoxin iron-sulfur binding domain protein [Desulfurispirillum indicum S5]|uniref:4Fe-4S ferredoxin iron-sulfur binding domain protein n=1 Tax=Desulfurispirillum indicum (strain ATCC BAA-1389 / DSM 22839 / S5) TaxID=653733 RepID=E6W1W1_DESIS|nr:4Fe-4S binding protein [Desulfurispirillum indicum]ADU65493.1 4Fe-4S ferredoxin iron-sulfur binding domain protein [Desulfurispirillum indicum S5]